MFRSTCPLVLAALCSADEKASAILGLASSSSANCSNLASPISTIQERSVGSRRAIRAPSSFVSRKGSPTIVARFRRVKKAARRSRTAIMDSLQHRVRLSHWARSSSRATPLDWPTLACHRRARQHLRRDRLSHRRAQQRIPSAALARPRLRVRRVGRRRVDGRAQSAPLQTRDFPLLFRVQSMIQMPAMPKLRVGVLYDATDSGAEDAAEAKAARRKRRRPKHDHEEIHEALKKTGHEPFYHTLDGTPESLHSLRDRARRPLLQPHRVLRRRRHQGDARRRLPRPARPPLHRAPGRTACTWRRTRRLAKKIFAFHGIRTPYFMTGYRGRLEWAHDIHFPVIVKPSLEDGSIGIRFSAVVGSLKGADGAHRPGPRRVRRRRC